MGKSYRAGGEMAKKRLRLKAYPFIIEVRRAAKDDFLSIR